MTELRSQPNLWVWISIFFGAASPLTIFDVGLSLVSTRLIIIILAFLYVRSIMHRMRYKLLRKDDLIFTSIYIDVRNYQVYDYQIITRKKYVIDVLEQKLRQNFANGVHNKLSRQTGVRISNKKNCHQETEDLYETYNYGNQNLRHVITQV